MKPEKVKGYLLRSFLIAVGWLSVAAGVAGIFLPLVPTVPLLLLAAACFARSSDSFHSWLIEHQRLGPLVRDYLNGTGIPFRAKIIAIAMTWVSISVSVYLVPMPWVKGVLVIIASGITVYLLRMPSVERP